MSAGFPVSDLTAWVDTHGERLVEEWRACCQIPSVSAQGADSVQAMADWLLDRARPLFDRFDVLRVPGGAPVLLGTVDGARSGRLLLYTHYDVVPVGEGWTREPFGAVRADGAVWARGAGDDKADVMARLHAIEAWRELRGRPPCTLLWLSEGMEEVGSPGLREVVAEHQDMLAADACLWESYYRSVDGEAATVGFGSRGVLNVELSVQLLPADTHSSLAGLYRSAAVLLARALASLFDRDGRVRIGGFYDDVVAFEVEDSTPVSALPLPGGVAAGAEESSALQSDDPRELMRRWLYEPTLNVASLHAGPDSGEHEATVLPAAARARIDMRLMPDQDPDRIAVLLREHLDREGLSEVAIRCDHAVPPARSALDSQLARAVRQASSELFDGAEPILHPVVPGSGPLHLFTAQGPLQAVMPPGTIRPDSGMHGPDENALERDYLDAVKLTLRTLELLASGAPLGAGAGTA